MRILKAENDFLLLVFAQAFVFLHILFEDDLFENRKNESMKMLFKYDKFYILSYFGKWRSFKTHINFNLKHK